jgi:hypothetical protein
MVISVIAEPRSGSTNLAVWFQRHQHFTVLFEPFNERMKHIANYKDGEPPRLWKYNTKHLLIKEICDPEYHEQFPELLNISDKVIILYRENVVSQKESWANARITGNWNKSWAPSEPKEISDELENELYDRKNELKTNFIDSGKYFTISYEELYYNNGFQRIVDYIGLPEVQNINFPYGKKYRVDVNLNKDKTAVFDHLI